MDKQSEADFYATGASAPATNTAWRRWLRRRLNDHEWNGLSADEGLRLLDYVDELEERLGERSN